MLRPFFSYRGGWEVHPPLFVTVGRSGSRCLGKLKASPPDSDGLILLSGAAQTKKPSLPRSENGRLVLSWAWGNKTCRWPPFLLDKSAFLGFSVRVGRPGAVDRRALPKKKFN